MYSYENQYRASLLAAMTVPPVIAGVVRGVDDASELSMPDFPFQGLQVGSQLFPKSLQVRQEVLTVGLDLLPDLVLLLGRCRVTQLHEQELLLLQILVPRLIEGHDQSFDRIWNAPQVAQQIAVGSSVLRDNGWRTCS